jgi:hypothetical protein
VAAAASADIRAAVGQLVLHVSSDVPLGLLTPTPGRSALHHQLSQLGSSAATHNNFALRIGASAAQPPPIPVSRASTGSAWARLGEASYALAAGALPYKLPTSTRPTVLRAAPQA